MLVGLRRQSAAGGWMNKKKKKLCGYSTTGYSLEARPFQDIPGPKSLPFIGTLYKYLPLIGDYSLTKLHKSGAKKFAEYGPLVREEIVPGVNTVLVFKPEDIAEVFENDRKHHPERRSHTALIKYRTDRKHIYNTPGLLPTNGETWWKLRKEFQKDLSKPLTITQYIKKVDKVTQQFVSLCRQKNSEDLLPLLSRLNLELTCLVVFDESLDIFSAEEMRQDSISSKLIDAAYTSNAVILPLDNGPRLWKYFDTPLYKKLCRSQKIMEDVAIKMVSKKLKRMKESAAIENPSLLEIYLMNKNLDEKDVVGMACDMLLAGIDTTTYASSFMLYHISRCSAVQEKLFAEARALLPATDTPITPATLRQAGYLKAVIKESFRMNPIAVGVGRVLLSDIVLSGYNVPKGTVVVTQNQVSCRLAEYFSDPETFKPERWLKESGELKNIHPYLVLPFGHGPRSCIARRLAEQNIQILLLRMCRAYDLKWKGGILDCISQPVNKPDGPVSLNFTPR